MAVTKELHNILPVDRILCLIYRCAGAYGQRVPCVECSLGGYNCVPEGTRCMEPQDWILYGEPGLSNTCGYGLHCMDYDVFPVIGTCK